MDKDDVVVQLSDVLKAIAPDSTPFYNGPQKFPKSEMAEINQDTPWEEMADIAEKAAKKEDLSIWKGDGDFGSVEEFAAYAYHLGRMVALSDIAVNMEVKKGEVKVELFSVDVGLDISARTDFVHWEDEYEGWMNFSNIERNGQIRKIVFEREEHGQDD